MKSPMTTSTAMISRPSRVNILGDRRLSLPTTPRGAAPDQAGPSPATETSPRANLRTLSNFSEAFLLVRRPHFYSLWSNVVSWEKQIGNSSHVLEEATVLVELQAAGLTVQKKTTKVWRTCSFGILLLFFSLAPGPLMRYENLGCAVLGSPLAVVVRSVVRGE